MNLFNRSNKPQKSIADFKASAALINSEEAINAITGGTLSGCHTGGGMKVSSFAAAVQFNASALSAAAY